MVFNATFNNISITSWRSVLLVEETGVAKETTDLPHVINFIIYTTLIYNYSLLCQVERTEDCVTLIY